MIHSQESPFTSESFAQGLKRLREETNAVLIEGIIHTIAIVLAISGVLAVGDLQIHRPYVVALYVQKLLLFLVGTGIAIALHGPATRRWPRCFGLLFLAATAASCAIQGAITGDAVTPGPLLMVLTIGAACLLPWGVLPQAALAFISAIALVGNGYAVTGTAEGAVGVPLFTAALSAFAASVYLARFFERQRLRWRAQGMRLATEAAPHGDGRFRGVNDGLWDWNVETGEVYYSARWKEILGATPDEISPRLDEWQQRIHPDDALGFEADLLACIEDERPLFENEHRLRRNDGSYCWVLARGKASRNEAGKAIRVAGSLTDISTRKRIEAALNESESKYRDMIENLTDVVFGIDAEGRYTYLSPVIETMSGHTPAELLGRSAFHLIHPDDAPFVVEAFRRKMDGRPQTAVEFRLRAKSGAWIWVRSHGRPFEVEGKFAGLRGTVTDVTERKRAELEKTAVLEVARDIGGTLDVGEILERLHVRVAAALSCDFVFTFCWDPASNAFTAAGQYGCPADALAEFLTLKYPRDNPFVQRVGRGGTVVIDDIRAQPWIPIEQLERLHCVALVATPLRVRGRAYGGFCAAILEPSARRFEPRQVQLFEAMTRPVALAIEAADLYEAQQEDAAVAVAVAQFGQQMIASAHTPELLDRLCELTTDLLGCDASYTYRLDRETNEFVAVSHFGDEAEQWEALRVLHSPRALMAELSQALQQDGLVDVRIEPPYTLIPQEIGELMRRMGFTRALFVPLQRGEDVFAVHHVVRRGPSEPFTPKQQRIMRGIAQVAPLALETARLFAELQTANQVREHFVATLTHELRNPINAISGYHSLLLDDDGTFTDDQRDLLERAERCTMELNSLIIATLDLSRFQTARVKIDWQELSVCDLLAELSREIQTPADKPALRLRWNPAPGVGTLYTDPLKLKMALRNLVVNAVKFTERGDVCIDARSRDGGVEFRVIDTGIGIPAKALPALFKPFTQAHGIESRRRGGAGLGLHLVKRLLDILGGSVHVESQVGRGSTFQIWLPRDGSLTPERSRTDQSEHTEVAA